MRLGFALIAALLPSHAFADSVTGTLNITGGLTLSSTGIDFSPLGGGTGTALADAFSNTGTFAVLNSGDPTAEQSGTIYDLDFATFTSGSLFITGFASAPAVVLDLTALGPAAFSAAGCTETPAPGETCTPPGSPFDFVDLPAGTGLDTLLSINFFGTAVDTGTGETSPFIGTISTQFAGSYQSLLAALADGTSESSTYSATITVTGGSDGGTGGGGTTVPEPGSSTLLLAGLGVLASLTQLRRLRGRQTAAG